MTPRNGLALALRGLFGALVISMVAACGAGPEQTEEAQGASRSATLNHACGPGRPPCSKGEYCGIYVGHPACPAALTPGTCQKIPTKCDVAKKKVKACNGKKYDSVCHANKEGQAALGEGQVVPEPEEEE